MQRLHEAGWLDRRVGFYLDEVAAYKVVALSLTN